MPLPGRRSVAGRYSSFYLPILDNSPNIAIKRLDFPLHINYNGDNNSSAQPMSTSTQKVCTSGAVVVVARR